MAYDSTIHFIITGGTIDSYYEGKKDTVIPNKKSIIPEYLESLNLNNKVKFSVVCMKDSRDLTNSDRRNILKIVSESPYKKIIITHGTYTVPDTARYLKANMKNIDKVIILTASLIPIKGFSPSDGSFNLGYSIAKVQELKEGIYVCINGKVFSPKEVAKDISEGKFISIFSK